MIRPNRKKLDMAGVQGKIAFDPTKPDVDVQLYNEIRKFMQGEMGLGGAGGTLANKLQTPKSFQASHVFDSPDDREKVTERLNTQMTEFLQEKVGELAIKSNMTIPGFLQTKGIHGINQIGTGDDAKLSAYRRDDFVKVSQNPITGSTEKLARAALKGFGAVHEVSGGTNEKRTLTSFMRPEEAKQINKMVDNTVKKVDLGLHSKGDMEPIFGTTEQREAFRLKHKANKNEIATEILEDEQNPATKEARSRILKQEAEKKVYKEQYRVMEDRGELESQNPMNIMEDIRRDLRKTYEKEQMTEFVRQDMIDKNELPDDNKKKRSGSAAAAAGQAMMSIMNGVKNIGSQLVKMLGFLSRIAMDMGRIISDSNTTGIDPNTTDRMVRYANKHPGYTRDNKFLFVDAANELMANFGTDNRLNNQKFAGGSATGPHQKMLRSAIDLFQHKDVFKTQNEIFSEATRLYIEAKPRKGQTLKEARAEQRAATKAYITDGLNAPAVAEGWDASLSIALSSGRLNLKDKKSALAYADNFLSKELQEKNLGRLSTGTTISTFTGESSGEVNIEKNLKSTDDLLGDLNSILESVMRSLLENTQTIKNLLHMLVGLALRIMTKFEVPGAKEQLKRFEKDESERAKKEYGSHLLTTMQLKQAGYNSIDWYLKKNKIKDPNAREEIFSSIEEMRPLPAKYKNFVKTGAGVNAIDAITAYQSGLKEAALGYRSMKEGLSPVDGSIDSIISSASGDLKVKRNFYGVAADKQLTQKWMQGIKTVNVGNSVREEIKNITKGNREKEAAERISALNKQAEQEFDSMSYLQQRYQILKHGSREGFIKSSVQTEMSGVNLDALSGAKEKREREKKKLEEETQKQLDKYNYKVPEKQTSSLPNNVSEGLASLGAYPSRLTQGMSTMGNEVGGDISKSPVDISTNVHITVNEKTILKETNLTDASQRRDFYANVG